MGEQSRARIAAHAIAAHGSKRAAARALGIHHRTLSRWLDADETPSFPDDDLSAEEILDHLEATFEQQQKHAQALHWFKIKAPDNLPIAVAWVGDPHIGSPGCNIKLLRRDVDILASTPGFRAVNMGDTADNWGGRLIRLYSESNTSRKRERKLAQWFLQESGVPWWLWLEGNHDAMDGAFTAHLRAINANLVPMVDWRARFRIAFPNGREVRVDAAHNHKGHSQYNPLHGQKRAALFDEEADLYVGAHHHDWGCHQEELAGGRVVTFVRARGYKFLDTFAHRHGFHEHQSGATVVTIFNPDAKNPASLIRPIPDIEEAADYLTWLRKKS